MTQAATASSGPGSIDVRMTRVRGLLGGPGRERQCGPDSVFCYNGVFIRRVPLETKEKRERARGCGASSPRAPFFPDSAIRDRLEVRPSGARTPLLSRCVLAAGLRLHRFKSLLNHHALPTEDWFKLAVELPPFLKQ